MPPLRDHTASTPSKRRTILGVHFFVGSADEAVDASMQGGLVVVPSAPVLIDLQHNAAQRQAMTGADLALTDSGLMVLLWRCFTGERVTRISGLEYLKRLLLQPELRRPGGVVWIMPSAEARDRNLAWLRAQGHPTTQDDCYVAPIYLDGELCDETLLEFVQRRRPNHVIIAVGGGVQERLGFYLKHALGYRPGIHCIGAAIGFLSGEQVRIPMWADYFYLGWLVRCLSAPARFVPRYWRAGQLVPMMLKFRGNLPPLSVRAQP